GERLPEAVRKHRKWGFAVPWSKYFRQDRELRDVIRQLPDCEPIRQGPVDRTKLRNAVNDFLNGETSSEAIIRQLFMIAVSYEACFTRTPVFAESMIAS